MADTNQKVREEFEAWVRQEWPDTYLERVPFGEGRKLEGCYWEVYVQMSWSVWQASRAALPSWQPMASCPKHVDVLFYREDCGVINGQLTYADSFMTDKERESGDYSEEEQFTEDAWCYGPQGVERLDGDLVPTHWMPYPAEPEVKP